MINIDSDNIDEYYEIVNNKIDKYFDHNIDPKSLKRYLKRGSNAMGKFIEQSELTDVKNIEKVIEDVIEDRIAKEELEIMTFENFSTDNFNIKFSLSENEQHIIADIYKVSLGHLVVDNNHVKLTGVKSERELYVFTREHLDNIFKQVCDKAYTQLTNDFINFDLLNLDIKLNGKIDKELFKSKTFDDINTNLIIIRKILSIKTDGYYTNQGGGKQGLYIFEKQR